MFFLSQQTSTSQPRNQPANTPTKTDESIEWLVEKVALEKDHGGWDMEVYGSRINKQNIPNPNPSG